MMCGGVRWVFAALLLVSGLASAQTPAGSQLTSPPMVAKPKVSGPACTHPDAALRAGIVERTLLEFRIVADGQITDVAVLESSGNADLDQAAVRCFKNWRADASEATGFGDLRAHIFWNLPPGASPTEIPAGTFTVNRHQTCESFYPDALKAKVGGAVKLEFTITEQGTVANPAVVESSGYPALDAAALACVPHWRYRPAMQSGAAVAVRWKAQIRFESTAFRELGNNASTCLKQAVVANQAAIASAGRTELSIRIPATGPAQVTITQSSGSSRLDALAVDCYSKAAPKPDAAPGNTEAAVEQNYYIYVPWKALLELFVTSNKLP